MFFLDEKGKIGFTGVVMNSKRRRNTILRVPLLAVFFAFAACVLLPAAQVRAQDTPVHVNLQLRWRHQFQFAGYYAAKEMGYYHQAGLSVTILERDKNQDPVQEILEGRAQFGVSNAEIMLHKLRGDPIVLLAATFQHSPLALVARTERGIREPRHLKGRAIKMTSHPRDAEIQAMLRNAGVSMDEIELAEGEVGLEDYRNPRIDAISAYITNEPFFLEQEGLNYRVISPRDYGVDFYGDCLFTSEEEARAHPKIVAAFTKASLKGWAYAMAHPEEVIDMILAHYNPNKTREHLQYEAEKMRRLILPDLVPIGSSNRERWRQIALTFTDLNMAPRSEDLDKTLDEFYPRAAPLSPWLKGLLWLLGGLCLAGALISFGLLLANRKLQKEVQQRRRAENELRLHSSILEQIGDLIAATKLDGKIIYANEAQAKLIGVSREKLLHRDAKILNAAIERDGAPEEIRKQTLANGFWSGELVANTASGQRMFLHARTWIMRNEEGVPTALCSISTDITGRKKAEQVLLRQEEELAEALERISFQVSNSPLAVVEWKNGSTIHDWSRRAEEIFGWRAEEVLGKTWTDFHFVHEDDLAFVNVKMERLFTGEDAYNIVLNRNFAKDGRLLHCQWYNSPLRDASGAVVSILSQVQDVTQWRETEDELIRARDAAEASNRAKSEFLANMSHEIRTPLNGALGMLQLLKGTELDEEQRYFADTATTAARSLLRILGDILDLSKIESGRMDILEETFKMCAVVEPVSNAFRDIAAAKGLAFTVEIDPNLPALLTGDPVRIRQILYNLVGNAIKFSQNGSVRLDIYPLKSSGEDTCYVHILVSDSGPGFPDDMIDHLFDSFTQADGALSRTYGGAGLGLSIVKRLVHLMGGTLAVDSRDGMGSDIHVTLKLGAKAMEKPALAPQPGLEPSKTGEKGGVLVAEDDAISRLALQRALEMAGFDVASVVDGRQALDAMKARAYDVALLDVRMPEMDGTEVSRAYREWERDNRMKKMRLIAVTAHAMAGDREQIMAEGMDDYVTKPVELNELVDKLRRMLNMA
ncbi:MAG: hypothetical protein PWQ57_1243 [Desulfovibrionales bacterium]|nr:hypothetical protein [Desulfovibrionales bacterium]